GAVGGGGAGRGAGRRPASLSSGASPGWAGRNGSLAPPAIRTPFRDARRNRNPPFSSTGPSWKAVRKGEHPLRGTVETSLKPAPNPASESIAPQATNRPAGFQHAPAAGFPHCFLFDQTLGVLPPLFRQPWQLAMKRRVMTIVFSRGVLRPMSKAEKPGTVPIRDSGGQNAIPTGVGRRG